ncbi:MAG: DNA-binding transcriptional regulator Fis [Gammaproteobacteria bacterium]|nr:MAG: DNA-binding transcriptional regulator Fis [Gammaproteobacteria bacterium]HDY81346.1 DNA-binding transcriptional regulator Fis [Halieaceae bacterium]
MTRAEPLHPPMSDETAAANDDNPATAPAQSLRASVTTAVRHYLDELDGQIATDVYQMVLAEIEAPLLAEIMTYTRNNQTKASIMLGLNRGTLRKKLKQYNLICDKGQRKPAS